MKRILFTLLILICMIHAVPGLAQETGGIDYLVLVNKLHALPEGWEEALETVHITNSLGDDVEVEKKAYDAYEQLKADLEENDGIFIELDSARRSVAEQQRIMDEFTEKYGAEYAAKTVALPGYSEHHTGLALDLYFRLDGKDIYYNEDLIQYPEIWAKIHEKMPAYGFILRYLEGKEHLTGYGYEPWHIRYIDDPETAAEITKKGITLEGWLGDVTETDVSIDLGKSDIFSEADLQAAAVRIECEMAAWAGIELHSLRYAGDEADSQENIDWLNSMNKGAGYTHAAEFLTDFHTSAETNEAWEADAEYKDYQWWLGRDAEGGWEIVSFGYG